MKSPKRFFGGSGFFFRFLDKTSTNRRRPDSARIGVLGGIVEILLRQPLFLFRRFGDVNSFDLKDDGSRSVVTACDHDAVVVRPALHDRAALQRRVDVSAHGVPRFAAKFPVHQMIKVVLLRRPLQKKRIPLLKERARPRLRIGEIKLLIFRKTLRLQNGYSTFMLHDLNSP